MPLEITPRYQRCLEITGIIVAAHCSYTKLQPSGVDRSPALSLIPGAGQESQWLSEIIDLNTPTGLEGQLLARPDAYRRRVFENFATIIWAGRETITLSNPLWLTQGGSQDAYGLRTKHCLDSFDMPLDEWFPDVSLFLQARSHRILGQNWDSVMRIALKLHEDDEVVESDFAHVSYRK